MLKKLLSIILGCFLVVSSVYPVGSSIYTSKAPFMIDKLLALGLIGAIDAIVIAGIINTKGPKVANVLPNGQVGPEKYNYLRDCGIVAATFLTTIFVVGLFQPVSKA